MNPVNGFDAIAALDLSPIKNKLMHKHSGEGWSRERADAAEFEYRRFLYLMKLYPRERTSPSVEVDTFWHYHILDTQKYAADCEAAFGYFLHHYPYVGMEGAEDDVQVHHQSAMRMQELYECTFGQAYPAASSGNAAYCGVAAATPAYCGVAAGRAAYCGVAAVGQSEPALRRQQPAYCGAATAKAAYCGAATKNAYCGATATKNAYCGATTTKTAYCGAPTVKTAYCGATTAKAAYCGATAGPHAYCGATTSAPAAGERGTAG